MNLRIIGHKSFLIILISSRIKQIFHRPIGASSSNGQCQDLRNSVSETVYTGCNVLLDVSEVIKLRNLSIINTIVIEPPINNSHMHVCYLHYRTNSCTCTKSSVFTSSKRLLVFSCSLKFEMFSKESIKEVFT